jgi:hypothetical protein
MQTHILCVYFSFDKVAGFVRVLVFHYIRLAIQSGFSMAWIQCMVLTMCSA